MTPVATAASDLPESMGWVVPDFATEGDDEPTTTAAGDPTYGRIDPDIQRAVDEAQPRTLGERVAMENTLQARRDARLNVDDLAGIVPPRPDRHAVDVIHDALLVAESESEISRSEYLAAIAWIDREQSKAVCDE
jgi:hypothetical protein